MLDLAGPPSSEKKGWRGWVSIFFVFFCKFLMRGWAGWGWRMRGDRPKGGVSGPY